MPSTLSPSIRPRVIIVPGCGCSPIRDANWYEWFEQKLLTQHSELFSEVILQDMPDPIIAHENIWVPFLRDTLNADENTIVIGHSSGAVAALRLAEHTRLRGIVLVSACWTDLGMESEREAGYYSRPWLYDNVRQNTHWVMQYHGDNDNLIPLHEADHVAAQLGLTVGIEYKVIPRASHFFQSKYVQVIFDDLVAKVSSSSLSSTSTVTGEMCDNK